MKILIFRGFFGLFVLVRENFAVSLSIAEKDYYCFDKQLNYSAAMMEWQRLNAHLAFLETETEANDVHSSAVDTETTPSVGALEDCEKDIEAVTTPVNTAGRDKQFVPEENDQNFIEFLFGELKMVRSVTAQTSGTFYIETQFVPDGAWIPYADTLQFGPTGSDLMVFPIIPSPAFGVRVHPTETITVTVQGCAHSPTTTQEVTTEKEINTTQEITTQTEVTTKKEVTTTQELTTVQETTSTLETTTAPGVTTAKDITTTQDTTVTQEPTLTQDTMTNGEGHTPGHNTTTTLGITASKADTFTTTQQSSTKLDYITTQGNKILVTDTRTTHAVMITETDTTIPEITTTQEDTTIPEAITTQADTAIPEVTTTHEDTVSYEVTTTQEDTVSHEVTTTQADTTIPDVTTTQEDTTNNKVTTTPADTTGITPTSWLKIVSEPEHKTSVAMVTTDDSNSAESLDNITASTTSTANYTKQEPFDFQSASGETFRRVSPPMFTESDKRVSAIAVGSLGIFILIAVLASIILLDCASLSRDFEMLKENLNCVKGEAHQRKRRKKTEDFKQTVRGP